MIEKERLRVVYDVHEVPAGPGARLKVEPDCNELRNHVEHWITGLLRSSDCGFVEEIHSLGAIRGNIRAGEAPVKRQSAYGYSRGLFTNGRRTSNS